MARSLPELILFISIPASPSVPFDFSGLPFTRDSRDRSRDPVPGWRVDYPSCRQRLPAIAQSAAMGRTGSALSRRDSLSAPPRPARASRRGGCTDRGGRNGLVFLMIRRPPRSTLFPYRVTGDFRLGVS